MYNKHTREHRKFRYNFLNCPKLARGYTYRSEMDRCGVNEQGVKRAPGNHRVESELPNVAGDNTEKKWRSKASQAITNQVGSSPQFLSLSERFPTSVEEKTRADHPATR